MTASASADGRRSAALVAAGILLSRLAGLVREALLARFFGVGLAVDAFRAALRIPNVLQNLLGEGVLSASFIPVYARLLEEDDDEAGRVAGAVAGLVLATAGALVVAGVVFARPLATVLAPGFEGERLELTVTLTRIVTPGVGLLALSAWCLAVLNSHRRFFVSYAAPVLWNAAQIAELVALGLRGWADLDLVRALAWGVLAGGALQLAVQLPAVLRLVPRFRPSLRTDLPGVRTAVRRFVPVVAGRGVVQLSGYVDLVLASLLAVGAVSALGFAQILHVLPISLFGMSVAAAELPELSRLDAEGVAALRRRVHEGLARIGFWVVPAAAAYLAAGDLVVGLLFERGEFGPAATRQVWLVLAAYSVGLLATTASRLLQNALYALGDARSPARYAAVRVAVATVLALAAMFPLDTLGVTASGITADPAPGTLRLGPAGIALGAGVAAWVELGLLRRRLRLAGIGRVGVGGGHLATVLIAGAVLLAAAVGLRFAGAHLPVPLAAAAVLVPAGLAYVAVARALAHPEARALTAAARRGSHRVRERAGHDH